MAYKTIVLFLLLIFIQNVVFGQIDSVAIETEIPEMDTVCAIDLLYHKIDSIMINAIQQKAFPGGVVYASHHGNPILESAYGFHTYDSLIDVKCSDIYDLASVSKASGATLALMKLYELKLIHLDDPISAYVDGFWLNRRGKSTLREALTHQAGFQSWIKYYEQIKKKNGKYRNHTIKEEPSSDYPFQVAEGMYLHKDFYQKIKKFIRHSTFDSEKKHVYSDLFFYLVPEIVQSASGIKYEEFLSYYFYDSLGATSIGFNPYDRYDGYQIVPTEIDTFFRMEPIHGKVHDEGAILMKGVSGHAGLFASAIDLAKVWQMLLNGGTYAGREYLKPATIQLFTSYQFPQNGNRKGLGFDKPLLEYDSIISSVGKSASVYSYGHTGFTGPLVWADPLYDFLFVFLTNRVYPSRDSKAIYNLNVRPTLHETFYQFLQETVDELGNTEH